MKTMRRVLFLYPIITMVSGTVWASGESGYEAEINRIDRIGPDASALAAYGDNPVDVRTLSVVNPDQIDIPELREGRPLPRYDRPLTLEVWYPAADGTGAGGTYHRDVRLSDGAAMVELTGRAVRDAPPASSAMPYPLVIISHGYPGNRFLLSHLGDNLASKGYVAAAVDHKESTYDNRGAFGSTLVNRPLDQLFVLDAVDDMSKQPDHFLAGLADASNTGIIGCSMGGYGAVIVAGYENGVKAVFETGVNTERYLLTFHYANHNAAAPMPAPAESRRPSENPDSIPFNHYADTVWDTVRMNNITQHFITAFLGGYLKDDDELRTYLDVVEHSRDAVYALEDDGTPRPEHNYWKGFLNRTAKGLSLSPKAAGA